MRKQFDTEKNFEKGKFFKQKQQRISTKMKENT